MKSPWHGRTQQYAHRPFKSILGRCILFITFTIVMLLLYVAIGADRITILRPSAALIQSSKPEENSPIPIPAEEFKAPSPAPSLAVVSPAPAPSWASINASSEVLDVGASTDVAPETGAAPGVPPDSGVTSANSTMCDGRRIFVYQMPAEFNEELARNCHNLSGWPSMCEDISNHGFGVLPEASPLRPSDMWYRTDQFTLEVIMHERLKVYSCLTTNPDEASLFYIPFYHTLDLIRNLYNKQDIPSRDRLGNKFVSWLRSQAPWQRHHGHRHVLVLGRIYWDFCRSDSNNDTWGSNLVTHSELFNVTKLLIERSPWKSDTVGIPYPTSFHPSSEADVRTWQATVRASPRRHFVSVAGAKRLKSLTGGIRDAVFDQCANSSICNQLVCTKALCVGKPETIIRMGLESVFCLQPPGDSPTRKGIFDSLQAGCIPVLFNQQQAVQQYLFHLPGNGTNYSVVIPEDDVVLRHYDVMDHLSQIPESEIERMRENIVQLLPKLLYRNPKLTGEYAAKDAFDVAMDGLFQRFQAEEAGGARHPTS